MKKINGKQAKELMENQKTKFIDVDSSSDFKRSHIKGSVNIPHSDSEFVSKCSRVQSDKNQEVVLCGQENLSREIRSLANDLEKAGYKKVYQYEANPSDWQSSQLTIQKG